MRVKIKFDPDGEYGYPKNIIISAQQLVRDYIDHLNEVEDADTISFLRKTEIGKAVDFVAEMWELDYDVVSTRNIRRCSVCGKLISSGYLFDGTDAFCNKDCATRFFDNDEGCVDILIDEGERLVWHDEFPLRDHYRVNIGHFATECFHHFDNEDRMFQWISEMIGEKVSSFEDCEEWTRKQDDEKGRYIEILCIDNIPEFYKHRREYVQCLQDCDDLMTKAQRLPLGAKRDYLIRRFGKRYEDANLYWDAYPEIWQGEI